MQHTESTLMSNVSRFVDRVALADRVVGWVAGRIIPQETAQAIYYCDPNLTYICESRCDIDVSICQDPNYGRYNYRFKFSTDQASCYTNFRWCGQGCTTCN